MGNLSRIHTYTYTYIYIYTYIHIYIYIYIYGITGMPRETLAGAVSETAGLKADSTHTVHLSKV